MTMNLFGFLVFLFLVFGLLFLIQRFWIRSLWRLIDNFPSKKFRFAVKGIVATLLLVFIAVLLERITGIRFLQRSRVVAYVFSLTQLWLFASLLAFFCFGVVKVTEYMWFGIKDLLARQKPSEPDDHSRRLFFRTAARVAAAIPLVAGLYGFAAERFSYRVRRVEVPIANLPPALDGFQIVQLSDIHSGDYMPLEEVRRAVDMANELRADIAVVTGDFISSERDPLAGCIAELGRLKAPLGAWGCNGNHEIYSNAEDQAEELFREHGMTLLRQQNRVIQYKGASLNLIGVDYQRDHMVQGPRPPMLQGIDSLVQRDIPNILLSHNPNSFTKAAELGIELSLAGHTHGGQVTVEILDKRYTPARFITPFTAGLYDLPAGSNLAASNQSGAPKRAFLYVNRGLGTFGLPARIGVDPEITLLRLRRG